MNLSDDQIAGRAFTLNPTETLSTSVVDASYDADFDEYNAEETISRYRRDTAGDGVSYLLRNSYGPIFVQAAHDVIRETGAKSLRIIEFGCGAGMALQYVVEALQLEGIEVELAVGTDFVPRMVEAATDELERFGSDAARASVRFVVATNEELASQIADGLGEPLESISGSFHLALGVNTFRYPVRHGNGAQAVEQLERLLTPGGRVVMIDMNDRFPYGAKPKRGEGRVPVRFGAAELPTLDGYAAPFAAGAFEVLEKRHFSWIPHSARGLRFRVARAATPILDRIAPDRAMRSLVVAKRR
jgi:SAM-dependent methyltransferase